MRRHLTIICIVYLIGFCSGKAFSKNTGDSIKTKPFHLKNFITSVEFGTQYCYRFASGTSKYRQVSYKWDGADNLGYSKPSEYYDPKNEIWGIGYIGGVFGNVKIYEGFRGKFGLIYETFNYETRYIDTFYIHYYKSFYDYDHTVKRVGNTKMIYEYRNLSMPLSLSYYFKLSKRILIDVELGTEVGCKLFQYETKRYGKVGGRVEDNSISFPIDWQLGLLPYTNVFNVFGSIGFNYFFCKKAFISFQPYFKTVPGPVSKNPARLYSIGGKLGINF